jgi:hypothetical protein
MHSAMAPTTCHSQWLTTHLVVVLVIDIAIGWDWLKGRVRMVPTHNLQVKRRDALPHLCYGNDWAFQPPQ